MQSNISIKKEFQKNENKTRRKKSNDESRHTSEKNKRKQDLKKKRC